MTAWNNMDGTCLICRLLEERRTTAKKISDGEIVAYNLIMGGVLAASGPMAFAAMLMTACAQHRDDMAQALGALAEPNGLTKRKMIETFGAAVVPDSEMVFS
jgi:hypothetical protein